MILVQISKFLFVTRNLILIIGICRRYIDRHKNEVKIGTEFSDKREDMICTCTEFYLLKLPKHKMYAYTMQNIKHTLP